MFLIIRATKVEHIADADPSKRWLGNWLEVVPQDAEITRPRWRICVPEYRLMCDAIMSDIQHPEGSGATALEEIRRVESGEEDLVKADGNAWVAYITRDKVWFRGLYDQGEGGEVTFEQYKLAVQTYVRFLSDSQSKPIEVKLPSASPTPKRRSAAKPPKETRLQLMLRIQPSRPIEHDGQGRLRMTPRINVVDHIGTGVSRFGPMCAAIDDVIREPEQSGKLVLRLIRTVESQKADSKEVSGKDWLIRVSRQKVWFEPMHGQGDVGGASLAQFRLAARLYVKFRSDPQLTPIEVKFPE